MRNPATHSKRAGALIPIVVVLLYSGSIAPDVFAAERTRKAQTVVAVTGSEIVLTSPKGEVRRVAWSSLTKVVLRTTDEGPYLPDIFWLFYAGGDKPALTVIGGTEGDQDLVPALQERLPHFRNDLLIKAMTSPYNHIYLLWEKDKAPPAPGVTPPPH
jgi:hypothetical protein